MTPHRIFFILKSNLSLGEGFLISESQEIKLFSSENFQELIALSENAEVTVIVPACDVLLTTVILPRINRQKLLQALPFALEDNLIDDVSNLHFAISEQQADGLLYVAIASKMKMQSWMEMLKNVGIYPNFMLPMTLALPFEHGSWQVYCYDGINIVRTDQYTGFTADHETFEKILESVPLEIPVNQLEGKIPFRFENNNLNLLQGHYKAKRKTKHTKNVWRYALYVVLACAGISFFNNLISTLILHIKSTSLNHAIEKIYYNNFPHATSLTAPKERMKQRLKELETATQKNNFLSLLAIATQSFSHIQGVRLHTLDYRSGVLTFELSSASFDNLDALIRDFNTHNLTVKQQNSATVGTQVKSTFIISAGAP